MNRSLIVLVFDVLLALHARNARESIGPWKREVLDPPLWTGVTHVQCTVGLGYDQRGITKWEMALVATSFIICVHYYYRLVVVLEFAQWFVITNLSLDSPCPH